MWYGGGGESEMGDAEEMEDAICIPLAHLTSSPELPCHVTSCQIDGMGWWWLVRTQHMIDQLAYKLCRL